MVVNDLLWVPTISDLRFLMVGPNAQTYRPEQLGWVPQLRQVP